MIGVTGATGFIGSHLMEKLGEVGFAIDLRLEDDEIIKDLKNRSCDLIFHLASPLPSNEKNKQDQIKNDTINLAEKIVRIADSLDNMRFIVLSTIRVHSNNENCFTTNSEINPIDGYGTGKMKMEKILMNSNHESFILRCSSVQGVDLNGKPRGLIGTFAKQEKEGALKIMGDGLAIKDFIHIDDLIILLFDLINVFPLDKSLIYPVGGGNKMDVITLANKFLDNKRCNLMYIEPALYELSGYVDNSELLDLIPWKPKWSIDNMINEARRAI